MLPKEFEVYLDEEGVISRLPVKLSKKVALANWAAGLFSEDRIYTEPEVNAIIGQYILDFALIRRILVTSGQLVRDPYGREYSKPDI